jgi:hypothetical protein
MSYTINRYCKIKQQKLWSTDFNYQDPESSFEDFVRSVYSKTDMNYPKLFKMDNLSKLAMLTAEVLLTKSSLSSYAEDEIGVVLGNAFSTIDTDLKYFHTVANKAAYFPSPSLFVYTLPNIMIGEICIKYRIKGENALFVFKEFEHNFINNYVTNLLDTGKIKCCITGWIDFNSHEYESILFLVEKHATPHSIDYNFDNTSQLYLDQKL